MAGFFARHGDLAEDLADYFSEFDIIVSYLYDPDEIFRQQHPTMFSRSIYSRSPSAG